jgi:hypothetical protein
MTNLWASGLLYWIFAELGWENGIEGFVLKFKTVTEVDLAPTTKVKE